VLTPSCGHTSDATCKTALTAHLHAADAGAHKTSPKPETPHDFHTFLCPFACPHLQCS
jgi:hypothetical protein